MHGVIRVDGQGTQMAGVAKLQRRPQATVRNPIARDIAPALLGWYDRERRQMPWRAELGERADPYRVWLSEIMLQQTTVKTVTP